MCFFISDSLDSNSIFPRMRRSDFPRFLMVSEHFCRFGSVMHLTSFNKMCSARRICNPPLHVAFSRSLINLIGFLSLCPQKWWPNLQNHAGAPVDAGKTGWFYSRPSLQQFRKDTIFRYIQIFNGLNCWCVWSICVKQRSDHHLKLRVKTSTATVLLSLNSIVTQSYSSAYPSSWYLDILTSWYLEILWFWYHFGII